MEDSGLSLALTLQAFACAGGEKHKSKYFYHEWFLSGEKGTFIRLVIESMETDRDSSGNRQTSTREEEFMVLVLLSLLDKESTTSVLSTCLCI